METNVPRKINIHVGAHKTATTYIQKVLRANRETLSRHGIKYIPMQNIRKNLTRKILAYKYRGESRSSTVIGIREYIGEKFTENYRTLVISDENLIGSCREIHIRSDLYPGAADRLQLLAEALHTYDINVFICVREYVDFFPSAYSEYLRHNDFIRFEKFLGGIDPKREYWARVVNNIAGVFGVSKTHVWRYEDFRKGVKRVMADLIASDDVTLLYDIEDARPSMSDLSIRALYKLDETLAPAETRKLVKAVTSAFPKDEGYEGYSPWRDRQRLLWAAKYKNELEIIRQHDGVLMDLG